MLFSWHCVIYKLNLLCNLWAGNLWLHTRAWSFNLSISLSNEFFKGGQKRLEFGWVDFFFVVSGLSDWSLWCWFLTCYWSFCWRRACVNFLREQNELCRWCWRAWTGWSFTGRSYRRRLLSLRCRVMNCWERLVNWWRRLMNCWWRFVRCLRKFWCQSCKIFRLFQDSASFTSRFSCGSGIGRCCGARGFTGCCFCWTGDDRCSLLVVRNFFTKEILSVWKLWNNLSNLSELPIYSQSYRVLFFIFIWILFITFFGCCRWCGAIMCCAFLCCAVMGGAGWCWLYEAAFDCRRSSRRCCWLDYAACWSLGSISRDYRIKESSDWLGRSFVFYFDGNWSGYLANGWWQEGVWA